MGGCGIVLYGAAMMLSKNFLWGIGAIVLMFLAVMFVYVFHFPKYHADQVMTVFSVHFTRGAVSVHLSDPGTELGKISGVAHFYQLLDL